MDFDKKAFRHNLTRSEKYNRRGFGHKKETLELMNQQYTSKMRICWNVNWRREWVKKLGLSCVKTF